MDVLELKILFIFVILTTSSTCGLTPILFGKFLDRKIKMRVATKRAWLSRASCFGAGVFMYVCFLGLLPEADKKFHVIMEKVAEKGYTHIAAFPWPNLIVVSGFLFIFTIDKVVHAIDEGKHRQKTHQTGSEFVPLQSTARDGATPFEKQNGQNKMDDEMQIAIHHTPPETHGVPSSLIILIALCMHAIFEGMAVGLQTSGENVLSFSVAIIIHESVMAFTFGLTVAKGDMSRCKKILYVFIFALSIPSGIAIGIGMKEGDNDVSYIVSAVFESFAPGIFIHVIFIEIIGSEFSHTHIEDEDASGVVRSRPRNEVLMILSQVLSIIAGFILIVVVNLLTPHPE